ILLMFGVGMHFSMEDLWAMRSIAVPGAIIQIVAATAMGAGVALLWGWTLGAGLVFGLALSVASTVVLLRALAEQLGGVASADHENGAGVWVALGITLGKVAAFIALMLIFGTRLFPWLLKQVERTGSRELFTLASVALAVGVAYGSAKLFGVSLAL